MTRLRHGATHSGFAPRRAAAPGAARLALLLLLAPPAPANAGKPAACPGPQTCMTPWGETIRGVFRRWPKGDPAIDWSKTPSPIVSPQTRILKKVTP